MQNRVFFLLTVGVLLFGSIVPGGAGELSVPDPVPDLIQAPVSPDAGVQGIEPDDSGSLAETNRILVRFRISSDTGGSAVTASEEIISATNTMIGATVVHAFSPEFLPGLQIVEIPAGENVDDAIARYRMSPYVEYAEPDQVISVEQPSLTSIHAPSESVTQTVPDDPLFPEQWALDNTGQSGGTPGADIDATGAWNITNESTGVIIGIIGTGVDYTHPDLSENIWTDPITGEHGYDLFLNIPDPMDEQGDGTRTAGIIAAAGNNGIGIAGTTWKAEIMPIKATDQWGSIQYSSIIQGIEYASLHQADILVLPKNPSLSVKYICTNEAFYEAISHFSGLVVWSTQDLKDDLNQMTNNANPILFTSPNLILVTASDNQDHKVDLSAYGNRCVHLAAPGKNIITTAIAGRENIFSDDFSTAANWTMDPAWTISDGLKANATGNCTLKAPLNLTGIEHPELTFQVLSSLTTGVLYLEGSVDGTTWSPIEQILPSPDTGWYTSRSSMQEFSGERTVYFRFRHVASGPDDQVFVDDVTLNALSDVYSAGTGDQAAFVAGTASLVKKMHPDYSAVQIRSAVMNTVDHIPGLDLYCRSGGRLNASAAVRFQTRPYDATGGMSVIPKAHGGTEVRVTIRMINAGTSDWTNGAGVSLKPENEIARIMGPAVIPLPGNQTVRPGEGCTFEIPVTVPAAFGTYWPEWRMYRENIPFGESYYVKIESTTWETIAPLPETQYYQAVIADGAYIYSISGSNGSTSTDYTDHTWRYDIRNNTWSACSPLPEPLVSSDGQAITGKLYIAGGFGINGRTNRTYVYDPAGDSWTAIPAGAGTPAVYAYRTGVIGDRLYRIGGSSQDAYLNSFVWALNTTTNTWSPAEPMHEGRTFFASSSGDGKIIVAGTSNTTELFDGKNWSYLQDIPGTKEWIQTTGGSAPDGSLWMAGGYLYGPDDKNLGSDYTGTYNRSTGEWRLTPALPKMTRPRHLPFGVMGLDGNFYLIGGRGTLANGSLGTLSECERLHVFDPVISPVTNMTNTSYATDRITWTWNEPGDRVYGSVMVSLNGIFQGNLTKGSSAFTATGLAPGTSYTLSTRTVDLFGTPDDAWANHTAMTAPTPLVYTLNSSSDPFGYIRPEGMVTKSAGSDQTYDIRSLPGAEIARLTDNDTPVPVPAGAVSYTYPLTGIADNHTVTVTNDAKEGVILAAFTANTTSGQAPLTVFFNDTSAGGPDQWYWTFGDGTSSMDRNVTHTYQAPGVYDVSLWIRNSQATGSIEKPGLITVT